MYCSPNIAARQINRQVCTGRRLIWVINTGEAFDLARSRLLVNAALVRLLRMLKRCSNVHEVERTVLLDRLPRRLPARLERRNWSDDSSSAGLGQL